MRIARLFKLPQLLMSEKDKQLIAQAERLGSADWDIADLLAEQAESESARNYIKSIASYLYHKTEERAGLL